MSPRPKTASDAAILDAAARLLAGSGPARMRLEDVAREVGLSPATLLLRFKSKTEAAAGRRRARHRRHGRALPRAPPQQHLTAARHHRSLRLRARDGGRASAAGQPARLPPAQPRGSRVPRVRHERHDATLEKEMAKLLEDAREKGEVVDCCTRGAGPRGDRHDARIAPHLERARPAHHTRAMGARRHRNAARSVPRARSAARVALAAAPLPPRRRAPPRPVAVPAIDGSARRS